MRIDFGDVSPFSQNAREMDRVVAIARLGAAATATAMARYLAERTANKTLRRTSHAPGAWRRAKPGSPPAYASGKLARGMYFKPARGGLRATAWVGNSVEYARALEYGCKDIVPVNKKFMHWVDSGGSWYHKILPKPEHPFLEPTIREAIRDGELHRIAIETFRKYDP